MALKFIITVDTEADNQWQEETSLTLENLKFIPRFQELCERFNFIPTYLLTYEVAANLDFTKWLGQKVKAGKADFGAHLHPWSNPPFRNEKEKTEKTFPCELEEEALRAKLETLTNLLAENIGRQPIVFRAGRWGVSKRVMEVLLSLGYKVDSSVTPLINWPKLITRAPLEMNFAMSPLTPYRFAGLVEVPMTIVPVPRLMVAFGPVGNKLFYKKVWGRIFPQTSTVDLIGAYQVAERLNLPIFQFMTHSSELMPGGSIYNKTPEAIEEFYSKLEEFFTHLASQEIRSLGLGAIDERDIKTSRWPKFAE